MSTADRISGGVVAIPPSGAPITQALATLSPDHRVVIALRYDRDLAADEIARRLDIPVGTVRSRLHYALRHLHETIDGLAREGTTR